MALHLLVRARTARQHPGAVAGCNARPVILDRVATHILAFEGDSETTWFEGTWGEYAAWVKETRGAEALEPHRIKYKPLVRS